MKILMSKNFLVTSHTKYVGKGSIFVAVKGQKENGIDYIVQALQKGAKTIVIQKDVLLPDEILYVIQSHGAVLARVENPRRALAQLSAQAYGYPAHKVKIIAVTGTKGKTTTSWLLAHLLSQAGKKTALLSTVRNRIGNVELPTELTTPQPDYIHAFLHECVQQEIEWVIMETAAQAASLHRIDGIEFDGALYTNFSPTHAEFYADIEDYFAAKQSILQQVKLISPIILNGDDEQVANLQNNFKQAFCLYRDMPSKDLSFNQLPATLGLAWQLKYQNKVAMFECPALIGTFNVYNCAMAAALAITLGIKPTILADGFKTFKGVPGRLERYQLPNGSQCIIDYAHTPSSFKAVLSLLRKMTTNLIVVFGAGGERDRTMRPQLGAIASTIADLVVLTTDNPRRENIQDIITDIQSGIDAITQSKRVVIELDRKEAIKKAYAHSSKGTIIALLGKGPDEYQLIGTTKIPFSERAIVTSLS